MHIIHDQLKPYFGATIKQNVKAPIGIIQIYGHCIATGYAISQSFVNLTEIGTSCGHG